MKAPRSLLMARNDLQRRLDMTEASPYADCLGDRINQLKNAIFLLDVKIERRLKEKSREHVMFCKNRTIAL